MEKTELASSLVVLDTATGQVVYIDRVDSGHALRMHVDIGTRFPWNCTSAGKAIAAFLPDMEAKLLLTGKLLRRTSASIQSALALRAHFEKIKAAGYATDDGENNEGVRCVAAPIFDSTGRPVAAISLSGYIGRIPLERLTKLGQVVSKATGTVSRSLGHRTK